MLSKELSNYINSEAEIYYDNNFIAANGYVYGVEKEMGISKIETEEWSRNCLAKRVLKQKEYFII